MIAQPSLAPRAETLWERQANNPVASIISGILGDGGAGGPDAAPSTTSTTTSSTRTTSTTRTTPSSTSSSSSSRSTATSTSTTSSSTRTTSTTSTTTSTSSSVLTTSTAAPTTSLSTSLFVSGTTTSQVVVTSIYTPVVTYTAVPTRSASNRTSSSNSGLIGGVVGGVIGGLVLLALIIGICILTRRRRSRTGHGYFLCFGERPSKAGSGDLGHSGGAWPTFDPQDDYAAAGHGAGAFGAGAGAGAAALGVGAAGAAASSRNRRRRRGQSATLPEEFDNEQDPEQYGDQGGYDNYNNSAHPSGGNYQGYPDMQEHHRGAAGALAAGAAAGGAANMYAHSRRTSNGPSYNNSPPTTSHSDVPAPWTLPMMGWHDTQGPYSAAGVGHPHGAGGGVSPPQAQFMVSPSEANARNGASRPGPDYSHFDPPEVRDARAREAARARGSYSNSGHPNALTPASPRQSHQRMASSPGSPSTDNGRMAGGAAPPAYVDAQDSLEEVNENPRRLHLTNAEPDMTDGDSSQGGPSGRQRASHNHKDSPPSATYRRN